MTTSPLDLTTVASVKSFIGVSASTDDALIQSLITSAGAWWLRQCGLGPADGSLPVYSPLAQLVAYNEQYDGSGSDTLFLRNCPITSLSSLIVNGVSVPQSTAWNVPGWVVVQGGKAVAIRWSACGFPTMARAFGRSFRRIGFPEGYGNVTVSYSAGYNAVPNDVEEANRMMVGLTYQRKARRDQASQAMAQGAGTLSFRDWEIAPEVARALAYYRRTSQVTASVLSGGGGIVSGGLQQDSFTGDGATIIFTLSAAPSGSVAWFRNGLIQTLGASSDYTISGQVITTNSAPGSGDSLIAIYQT